MSDSDQAKKMFRKGEILLFGAAGIAIVNWFVNNLMGKLIDFVIASPVSPFMVMLICVGGTMVIARWLGTTVEGDEISRPSLNQLAFWAVVGTVVFSYSHFRFWILGATIAFMIVVLTKIQKFPIIARVATILVAGLFVATVELTVINWQVPFTNLLVIWQAFAKPVNYWHILSAIGAFLCTRWLFDTWIEKIYNNLDPYGLP